MDIKSFNKSKSNTRIIKAIEFEITQRLIGLSREHAKRRRLKSLEFSFKKFLFKTSLSLTIITRQSMR